jgi:hypothetical protein
MPAQKAQQPLGTMEQPREASSRQTGVEEEMGFAGIVRFKFVNISVLINISAKRKSQIKSQAVLTEC